MSRRSVTSRPLWTLRVLLREKLLLSSTTIARDQLFLHPPPFLSERTIAPPHLHLLSLCSSTPVFLSSLICALQHGDALDSPLAFSSSRLYIRSHTQHHDLTPYDLRLGVLCVVEQ